jgi:hypothetical protein
VKRFLSSFERPSRKRLLAISQGLGRIFKVGADMFVHVESCFNDDQNGVVLQKVVSRIEVERMVLGLETNAMLCKAQPRACLP